MARQKFRKVNLSESRQALLERVNRVLSHYSALGYKMTLRQLYYQLVARDVIPNTKRDYDRLGDLLSDARMGGYVDWNAIEDRGRIPKKHSEWENLEEIMASVRRSFRLPRWRHQPNYVELWSEKDALASVLQPITEHFHVPMIINKGYSSTSAMYAGYKRFDEALDYGKNAVVLYLGDHDPSGLDMDRDIRNRLTEFGLSDIEVRRIGLTQEQIRRFNPPPNPAKLTDSRAQGYISQFGRVSWEVDAIPPEELDRLVRASIEDLTDMDYYNRVIEQEERLKEWILSQIEGSDKYSEEVIENDE